jgi:hypothetical protein
MCRIYREAVQDSARVQAWLSSGSDRSGPRGRACLSETAEVNDLNSTSLNENR